MSAILAVAVALILLYLLNNILIASNELSAKQQCKQSVQQYAKLRIRGIFTDIRAADIVCPVANVVISTDKDEKIKRQLADEMVDCFDNLGAGEFNLFDTKRGDATSYCVICSKISFTHKNKQIPGLQST